MERTLIKTQTQSVEKSNYTSSSITRKSVMSPNGNTLNLMKSSIIFAGLVEKKNPTSGKYRSKYLILTSQSLHWFEPSTNNHLVGVEKGQIPLTSIKFMNSIQSERNKSSTFEIIDCKDSRKLFQCSSITGADEWIDEIKFAMKPTSNYSINSNRSINEKNFSSNEKANFSDETTLLPPHIMLISIKRYEGDEVIIARDIEFNTLLLLSKLTVNDIVKVTMSNDKIITITVQQLEIQALRGGIHIDASQDEKSTCKLSYEVDKLSDTSLVIKNPIIEEDQKSNGNVEQADDLAVRPWLYYVLNMFVLIVSLRGIVLGFYFSWLEIIPEVFSLILCITNTTEIVLHFISKRKRSLIDTETVPMVAEIKETILTYQNYHLKVISFTDSVLEPTQLFEIDTQDDEETAGENSEAISRDDIPMRFIIGCEYVMKEARRRWDITRKWQDEIKLNSILQEKQPFFENMKENYPFYHCGRGKLGHPVFYERPGELNVKGMQECGISVDDQIRHFLFVTEFQFRVLCKGDETAKTIAIIDIEKVGMNALVGDTMEYLKRSVSIANNHYPERSYIIFVLNAPSWFSFLWRMVKPMVHENTQKKIQILSKSQTLQGLLQHIDIENIPVYYGKNLKVYTNHHRITNHF